MRVVEFLTEAFKAYHLEVHEVFLSSGLYNSLLYFFDHYPFHNMLHQRVSEIFMILLDKTAAATDDEALINSVLYETNLLRKILDTAQQGGVYTFQASGNALPRGHMPFIRRLATKLSDLQSKNDEVANFLDSIPEWADYVTQDLKPRNELESRPLGHDPRQRTDSNTSPSDEYFDLMFKGGSRKQLGLSSGLLSNNDNEKEEFEGTKTTKELGINGFEDDEDDDSDEVFDRIMFKTNA
jgi:SIT4 phosphatase-associated protein